MPARFDSFAAALADDPPVPPGGVRHHVLFLPSFHADTLLTVDLGDPSALRLRVFDVSLSTARTTQNILRQLREEPAPATPEPLALPRHHDARAVVPPARAATLRRELAALVPTLALPDDRRGVDGITLEVLVRDGDGDRRFAAWSPDPETPCHAYFKLLHALAGELLPAERAQARLKQLHSYLALGVPARDVGGIPRCLQIFGRLSSSHEGDLAALFAAVAADEPVVVDMRHFEGMGTLLYPLFRRFSRRPGALAWAVSANARKQLREAQVPADQLLADLADATLRVVDRARTR